ncbi:asparaginase [Halomicroarcula sp. GCM10025324]|uniref:asparaginase n=1 Tax=Haloarcula TaxID=2237 RepID=UPI0023E78614|nr:asparaginase [Halomicroarcula sp. ZS-22-S1]
MSAEAKPHVHIVATGGTIANVTGDYDSPDGFLTADALLEEMPEMAAVADVTSTGISRLGSSSLNPAVWYETYDEIMTQAESEDPPDGFVVTHGSNTSEETAYFLNLTLKTDLPVVVTAAQRGVNATGSDGFKNLFDAVRTAASPDAIGRGTMLVTNDEIHHARDVSKLASKRPDAWQSSNFGKIGLATPGQPVTFYRSVDRTTAPETVFDIDKTPVEDFPLTDIHIVYASMGDTGTVVDAIAEDAAGIIVAGFLTGGAASPEGPSQSEALERAAENEVPVVMCTRGSYGSIGRERVTDYPGGYGIGGDTLRPQKARILLALGLTETSDPEKLQEFFETY